MPRARAEEGEFKGNPVITVYTGHAWKDKEEYVTMGVRKAQAVDDCIDAIRVFVDKNVGQKRYPGRSNTDPAPARTIDDEAGVPF